MIKAHNLIKHFGTAQVLDRVSLQVHEGETMGIVGESGCGKSTLARCLIGLENLTSGEVYIEGVEISSLSLRQLYPIRRKIQMVFQDSHASLNPRMTVGDILQEPLIIHHLAHSKHSRTARVKQLLDLVGLPQYLQERFPHELSGGQRQRIGIARALAAEPKILICDEPISSLDVSVQAQIVNLLKKVQKEMGLTYLFIAHNLAMVRYLSTRIAVMYLGQIVEMAPADTLCSNPLHPYTQALLSAIPLPDPVKERSRPRIVLKGEAPSLLTTPKGCVFASRCPHAHPKCHTTRPEIRDIHPDHQVACHLTLPPENGPLKNRSSSATL